MINSWETALVKLNKLAETRGFKSDLAKRMGIHPVVIFTYLKGEKRPGIDFIDRLASALGVQAWELIKPSQSWPTDPRKLTPIEHLESALHILKYPGCITDNHKFDDHKS